MKRPYGQEARETLMAAAQYTRYQISLIRLDTRRYLGMARRSPALAFFQRTLENRIEQTGRERIEKARFSYAAYRRYVIEREAKAKGASA